MNHTPLLVIFVVLIAVISVPAYGELITDHVVINEVDTNPFGDDSLAISEWVELYNPTDTCLLYTSPSPRDRSLSRMPSSA